MSFNLLDAFRAFATALINRNSAEEVDAAVEALHTTLTEHIDAKISAPLPTPEVTEVKTEVPASSASAA